MNNIKNTGVIKFNKIIKRYDFLQKYWNFEKETFDTDALYNDLQAQIFSSRQVAIAKFLGGIWTNYNIYNFDIFNDIDYLDDAALHVVTHWIEHPFYP